MANPLMQKFIKSGVIEAQVMAESDMFNNKDRIPTELPILNLAFSGDLHGGIVSGLTIFAGESKSYKTLLALYCLKAYLNKYEDAIGIVYDSEFGITPAYLKMHNIDPERVLHVPVEDLELLKFDMVKKMNDLNKGDKVFFLIDSLGTLSSKKEVEDSLNEKSVADMTRAKSIRSLLRIITPHLTIKDIPCIVINHIYMTMEMYSKPVVSGGTAVMYNANQVFIITRKQEKDSEGHLLGYNFVINIEKSRFVREKSKFEFLVTFKDGIHRNSGLFELALEHGFLVSPTKGFYSVVNLETGEVAPDKLRAKAILQDSDFWQRLLTSEKFTNKVAEAYRLN